MSLMRCVCCGVVVDTDYDVETFPVDDVCVNCRDAQEQELQNQAAQAAEECDDDE